MRGFPQRCTAERGADCPQRGESTFSISAAWRFVVACPSTGKDANTKTVLRITSPDEHVFEMFNDGEKMMEITYTRQ